VGIGNPLDPFYGNFVMSFEKRNRGFARGSG
jgi:hypothetical protein